MSEIGYPSKAKQYGSDKIRDYAFKNGYRLPHGYETVARSTIEGTQMGEQAAEMLPYNNRKEVLVDDHDTNDIVKWIKREHPTNAKHYDKIADMFWAGDPASTSKALFGFMKDNVKYRVEDPDNQTVKTPGAILHHGYGDCKHYASFITGICCALNKMGYPITAKYRFTADRPGMEVHHVFSVVKDLESGKEYYNDPVLGEYDIRPKYHNIKDVDMPLYRISGTGQNLQQYSLPNEVKDFIHRYGRHRSGHHHQHEVVHHRTSNSSHMADTTYSSYVGAKKKHRNIFKEVLHGAEVNVKNINKGVKTNLENAKHLVLKVSLAAARGPFLSLVDLNAFNLAHRYRDTLMGPKRGALLKEWKQMGGNERAFINAVNNGYREYKKHHGGWNQARDRVNGTSVGYVGSRAVSGPEIAAWLALAGSIIAALGKFAGHSPEESKAMADTAKQGAHMLMKNGSDGIDMANGDAGPGGAAALNMAAADPNAPSMKISTGQDADGNPVMAVHDYSHPAMTQAGMAPADGGSSDDVDGGGGDTQLQPAGGADVDAANAAAANAAAAKNAPGAFDIFVGKVEKLFKEHTAAVLGVTATAAVVYTVATHKRRRR
jgi:hypothetical protein